MTAVLTSPSLNTLADLLEQLGDIPANRVRLHPTPGEATEQDAIEANAQYGSLFELIDGTLVEKAMGFYESLLAIAIAGFLREFVLPRRLGTVAGPDGMYRIVSGRIRLPDVSFTSWARVPLDYQSNAAPPVSPDLAIEILSAGNSEAEMQRKRKEYFACGTTLMWIVDPPSRTVAVYTDVESSPVVLTEDQSVDGGNVLPGFSFSIRKIFDEVQRPQP